MGKDTHQTVRQTDRAVNLELGQRTPQRAVRVQGKIICDSECILFIEGLVSEDKIYCAPHSRTKLYSFT